MRRFIRKDKEWWSVYSVVLFVGVMLLSLVALYSVYGIPLSNYYRPGFSTAQTENLHLCMSTTTGSITVAPFCPGGIIIGGM